jgi:hypothetical protein
MTTTQTTVAAPNGNELSEWHVDANGHFVYVPALLRPILN